MASNLSLHLSIYLSVYLSICWSVGWSICLLTGRTFALSSKLSSKSSSDYNFNFISSLFESYQVARVLKLQGGKLYRKCALKSTLHKTRLADISIDSPMESSSFPWSPSDNSLFGPLLAKLRASQNPRIEIRKETGDLLTKLSD